MPLTTHDIIALLVNEAATVDIYPPERSVLHPVLIRRGFKNKTSERFTFANGDIGIMHVYAFKTREVRFTMSRMLGMKHWISVDTTGEMSSVEGTGVVSLDRHLAQLNFEEYDVDTSTGETAAAVDDTTGANDITPSPEPEAQQEAAPAPVHPNVMAKNMVAAYRAATKTTGPIVDSDFVKVAQSIRSKNIPGAKATLRSVMDTKDEALVSKVLAAATSMPGSK